MMGQEQTVSTELEPEMELRPEGRRAELASVQLVVEERAPEAEGKLEEEQPAAG